jgi:hypothetical protein
MRWGHYEGSTDDCPVCHRYVSDNDAYDGMEGTPWYENTEQEDAQRWCRTHYTVLAKATEWLNYWHSQDENIMEDGEITRLAVRDWFEPGDTPRLLFDIIPQLDYHRRTMQLLGTPFHDEGGPATMTAFFTREDEGWELDHLVWEFDTQLSVLYTDGKVYTGEMGAASLKVDGEEEEG